MSKLPLVDAKTFEKVVLYLGFSVKERREAMFFIDIQMADIQHFHITVTGLSVDLSQGQY